MDYGCFTELWDFPANGVGGCQKPWVIIKLWVVTEIGYDRVPVFQCVATHICVVCSLSLSSLRVRVRLSRHLDHRNLLSQWQMHVGMFS